MVLRSCSCDREQQKHLGLEAYSTDDAVSTRYMNMRRALMF